MEFKKKPLKRAYLGPEPLEWWVMTILILSLTQYGCRKPDFGQFSGETMGTYYLIKSSYSSAESLQNDVDSILAEINLEVSGYIEHSLISRFNASDSGIVYSDWGSFPVHFDKNFALAKNVYRLSGGFFDPTVMPLVNFWGFGYKHTGPIDRIDSARVDSIRRFIGFDMIERVNSSEGQVYIRKNRPEMELDFSGLAKGYALDVIADYFNTLGTDHYLIDIGGEVRVKGKNQDGKNWLVGINRPLPDAGFSDSYIYLSLTDISLATSGNYRNFYELNGDVVSHTINPRSGFPERTHLLSATVLAKDCMTADAFATAFMVLGLDSSMVLVEKMEGIEAGFIALGRNNDLELMYSSGFEKYVYE